MQNKDCQNLRNCPFCGGKAYVDEWESSFNATRMKISCRHCGATLDWTQNCCCATREDPILGEVVTDRVAIDISPLEAWNRRADND